jgi:hypothetical protein
MAKVMANRYINACNAIGCAIKNGPGPCPTTSTTTWAVADAYSEAPDVLFHGPDYLGL